MRGGIVIAAVLLGCAAAAASRFMRSSMRARTTALVMTILLSHSLPQTVLV